MQIIVELMSETIFGSGHSVPGFVDLEIVYDDLGLPYFKGKTFKGKLREECENIVSLIKAGSLKKGYEDSIISIFGKEDCKTFNIVNFSDLKISKNISDYIEYGINEKALFSKQEVLAALTDTRYFTKLDKDGIAADGSLRQFRVINKGLTFECDLTLERDLTNEELELLSCGVKALKHIGCLENRGKGLIKASLMDNDKDISEKNINTFVERVNNN